MDKNSLVKKGLVVTIILLFLGMSINPLTVALIDFTKVTEMNGNNPPSTPIFLGPTEGFVDVEYSYSINSTDPDGDDIYYGIAWENGPGGFFGPYASGEEVIFSHTWNDAGIYLVNALAKDIYNAKSDFVFLEVIIREIIYVDDDNTAGPWNGTMEHPYQYIQDGIDVADSIDTVFVFNGTYYENIVINSSINLIGENKYSTIIDGGRKDDVVDIVTDSVYIGGFTIQNGALFWYATAGVRIKDSAFNIVENNIIQDNYAGVWTWDGNNNTVSHNIIKKNLRSAIRMDGKNNVIDNNSITDNGRAGIIFLNCNDSLISNNSISSSASNGISLGISYHNRICDNVITKCKAGIFLPKSSYNVVSRNIITDTTTYDGITLGGSYNVVSENTLINNTESGIRISNSSFNTIIKNVVKDSKSFGIWVKINSSDNVISQNTFINNPVHAFFTLCGKSTWDGNYWGRRRVLPKPIFGIRLLLPRIEFDWHPAREPYDMGV